MIKISILLFIAFISLLSTANADEYTEIAKRTHNFVLKIITGNDFSVLKDHVMNIIFESNEGDNIPNAYAIRKNDGIVIGITPAFVKLNFYISEISAANILENHIWAQCEDEYTRYVREAYQFSISNYYKGRQVYEILPPEQFGGACAGLATKYPFSGRLKVIRDTEVEISLIFTYLHELGHVFLGHLNNTPSTKELKGEEFFRISCKRRQYEAEADKFAVRTMYNMGWKYQIFSPTIWHVLIVTGGFDPTLESSSQHPNSAERMASVFAEGRSYTIANGESIPTELNKLIDEAISINKKIVDTFPPIEFPDANGFVCKN